MTALHKPERATYGQAVEAQHPEYNYVVCIGNVAVCADPFGRWTCCF